MFTRILVPTDFSAPSDIALEYARTLARHFGAALHVLHVIEEPTLESAVGAEALIPPTPAARTERLQDALERLAHRISEDDRGTLGARTEVVFGHPSTTIVEYASDNGFDLIVMGTHGREGIAHLLMGSVAERVVRSATCPVLTVHEGQVAPATRARVRLGLTSVA